MSGKPFSRQALQTALLVVVFTVQCSGEKSVRLTSTGVESLLEYHFHTYFDVNDPVQVAHAIELRNEIIANCVSKKIIAVPLHYHYDPEKPVLERKLFEMISKLLQNLLLKNVLNDFFLLFYGQIRT